MSKSQSWRWCVLVCVLGIQIVPASAIPRKARHRIVQIKFVRSGGFAGAATRVEGAVDLKGNNPAVTSDAAGYHRSLTPEEAEKVRCAADVLAACHNEGSSFHASAVPDGLQYDVTISTSDGKSQKLTINPASQTGGKSGISPDLAGWIQEEAQKIWEHRISKRNTAP